jgi:hypothetical protein
MDHVTANRAIIAPAFRAAISQHARFLAGWDKQFRQAWLEFAEWTANLPDDDDRFTTLATFGTGPDSRSWAEILDEYLDTHATNDGFGLCSINWFDFADRPGQPEEHFDRLLDLIILDAVSCGIYDLYWGD